MQKDFITVTPDSGNGNGTVTVAVLRTLQHHKEVLLLKCRVEELQGA